MATAGASADLSFKVRAKLLKSMPPVSMPMGGMRMSFTSELTILPKAVPMITPTARSMTLPRMANSLNSLNITPPHENLWLLQESVRQPESHALPHLQFGQNIFIVKCIDAKSRCEIFADLCSEDVVPYGIDR